MGSGLRTSEHSSSAGGWGEKRRREEIKNKIIKNKKIKREREKNREKKNRKKRTKTKTKKKEEEGGPLTVWQARDYGRSQKVATVRVVQMTRAAQIQQRERNRTKKRIY